MARGKDVVAAGAVVWRPRREVLLVHRPRYDDWSFPKGKLDAGEIPAVAAIREVQEETGLTIRLTRPLPLQRYPNGGERDKVVHYWVGRALGDDDVGGWVPNDEIDRVEWCTVDRAARRLSYPHDRTLLTDAERVHAPTTALVLLRHGHAEARKEWEGDDRLRPLARDGRQQAKALRARLAAYGVQQVVSSSSLRCVETVAPYAERAGLRLGTDPGLSEEDATPASVRAVIDRALTGESTVVCSHRPVLPLLFEAAGLEPVALDPGAGVVLHHRNGQVCAVEEIPAPGV